MQEDFKNNLPLTKFESMLKTNEVVFFDSSEFEGIIHYYFEQGRHSLAKKAINLGLSQHPSSINLKLLLAELYIYEDDLDKADRLLNQIYEIEPANEELYLNKATILSKRGKHEEAIASLHAALDFAHDSIDVLSMLGMEYLYLDNFSKAQRYFAKCIEIDGEDYSSLYNVIYCFDMENRHVDAIRFLNEFIDEKPFCEVAWHQLGRQYFIIEDYEKALEAFDYAVVIDDLFVGAYLEKAKTLERLKRYEEAIENYLVTTELDDPTAFAYYRVGKSYHALGDEDQAVQYFKKTVIEDPLLDKGWMSLSDLYFNAEDYNKALYYINKAIEIDETNNIFWRRFAEINLRLNLFEEVAQAFYKCLELGDENLEIYLGLVDVLNFIGEFDEALKYAVKANRNFPNHVEVEYRLSCLNFILGNNEKGVKHLKKALDKDAEHSLLFVDLYPTVFELQQVQDMLAQYM